MNMAILYATRHAGRVGLSQDSRSRLRLHVLSGIQHEHDPRVSLGVLESKLLIRQFNIETAFLNGNIDADVYMQPSEGMNVPEGYVCKLRKSLYGLKEAAAVWFKTFRAVFKRMGFEQCRADPCLFVHRDDRDDPAASPIFVILYVDDLLVGCEKEFQVEFVRKGLESHFTVKSHGDIREWRLSICERRGEMTMKQPSLLRGC